MNRYLTGPRKALLYARIALGVAARYAVRPRLFGAQHGSYPLFLARAWRLLRVFRHNKAVRVSNGYKLHLYLPAYPSPAFFYALETKLLRTPPGPTTVVFSMTRACSYKCPHCYQRRDAGPDLDEQLLLDTARSVRDAGVAMFDIEGGEPFERYDRLLTLVEALDERCETWINTTGEGLTRDRLEELRRAGLFGLMVSIHSPDPQQHDSFTGVAGSFEKACEALRLCRSLGLAAACNSVLSEQELRAGRLDRLMDLCRELDCDFVQLIHPKPAGTWIERREHMQRDSDLIARTRQEHLRYNGRNMPRHPSLAAQVFEEAPHVLGCTAGGVDRFYVNATGEVQPCEFLNVSFGNVNQEPFETIYSRMRSFFAVPGTDWLCCTQADSIAAALRKSGLDRLPLPWLLTRELVKTWKHGDPTPVYTKLGIYR